MKFYLLSWLLGLAATLHALPQAPLTISNDGSCGPAKGLTCLNSGFGDCCGPDRYCGSDNFHCGPGCDPTYGYCSPSVSLSSTSTSTTAVSTVTSSTVTSSTISSTVT